MSWSCFEGPRTASALTVERGERQLCPLGGLAVAPGRGDEAGAAVVVVLPDAAVSVDAVVSAGVAGVTMITDRTDRTT